MGYDMDRFIVGVDSEFSCQICKKVLENPSETPCEHYFCTGCISSWLQVNGTCPIDQKPLKAADLKKPNRLLRDLVAKLDIKCDYAVYGCTMIVKLDNLNNHQQTCNYNPDGEIQCSNGCNLQITRRDQTNNCHAHFNNRIQTQTVEISNLRMATKEKQEENSELKEQVTELQRLACQQQQTIDTLTFTSIRKVRFLSNKDIVWQTFENIKAHHDPGMLESNDRSKLGVAQSAHCLDSDHQFSVCVLSSGKLTGMGLTGTGTNVDKNLVYESNGSVRFDGALLHIIEPWDEGDFVSCDVKLPGRINNQYHTQGSASGEITFSKNYKCVFTAYLPDVSRFFATVLIYPM